MNKTKLVFFIILATAISVIATVLTNTSEVYYEAQEVYRVYLNGKSIGLIKNDEELANYIDTEQKEIKDKYQVETVYAPEGLSIEKEVTYNQAIEPTEDVYEKLKEQEDFTIDGYTVTITKTEKSEAGDEAITKKIVYLKNKEIFQEAVENIVLAFIDENKYQLYLDENQAVIATNTEGELIEKVYIKENITIRQDRVPANAQIFEDTKTLSAYLLYGTTEQQQTYVVKAGDTLDAIAEANKLNVRELLVTNPTLKTKDALLYPGQELNVGYISPLITVVEELHRVQYQEVSFKTVTREDPNYYVGYSRVSQEGVNGTKLATQKVKIENGTTTTTIEVASTELTAPVDRIVIVGSGTQYATGSTALWAWPSRTMTINEGYGWRTWDTVEGRMHYGVDIGANCGSSVYAANVGTVITAEYQYSFGNYIRIDHNNGYVTLYAHLSAIYVSVGQAVQMGQLIGASGNTGYSFGCHLHFQVMRGCSNSNSCSINPMLLY